jgi:hypothetical protein
LTSIAAKEQLEKKYHSVICDCNSVLNFSYQQIEQITRDLHTLFEIVRHGEGEEQVQKMSYNFSSSSTIHFFPPEIIPYLELLTSPEQGTASAAIATGTRGRGDVGTQRSRKKKRQRRKREKRSEKKNSPMREVGADELLLYSESSEEEMGESHRQLEQSPSHDEENEDDVFQLTTLEEDPFGHLKEFLLHSESDVGQTSHLLLEDKGERDREEEDVYLIDFESEEEEEEDGQERAATVPVTGEGGIEAKLELKHPERIVQFILPESKKKTKKVKKKLARWNPEPCSQCNRPFRGEGKGDPLSSSCSPASLRKVYPNPPSLCNPSQTIKYPWPTWTKSYPLCSLRGDRFPPSESVTRLSHSATATSRGLWQS